MTGIYDLKATTIDGEERALSEYEGKVMLITNVASKCGFTYQYGGLEELYEKYADRGLVVLGFPCDQFGGQEPGDEAAITEFCSLNYGVTFPMFSKVDVNGPATHPVYQWLKAQKRGVLGGAIKWNFTKFLVDASGHVVKRYGSATKPESIASEIESLLPRP